MISLDPKDHPFELELDIIKFDEEDNRVKITGFLGNNMEIQYEKGVLWLRGNEGNLKLYLKEEDLSELKEK